MENTTLGRTEYIVSRLGFGGAPAGLTNYLERYSPDDARQRTQVIDALRSALELGITFFDTAPGYGQGASESIFGEALADASDVYIATKISLNTDDVRRSIEDSLQRLRRDTLDLVQIHGTTYPPQLVNAILAPDGMLAQLEKLRDEGLIRYIGFTSEDNNPAVYQLIATDRFDVLQIAYNFLYQHPYETTRPFGSMLEAEQRNIGIVTMRTLTSGIFQKWIQQVNPANTFDYTPALLQFVLSNPLVDVALVGMRTVEEVKANVTIANDLSGRMDIAQLHEKYQ